MHAPSILAERKVLARPFAPFEAKVRSLGEGRSLYFEGDSVSRIYRVKSGVLRLSRLLEDGRRQVISFAFAGDVVGFPSQGLHHTDCDALRPTQIESIDVRALTEPGADPMLRAELMQAALQEISDMQDHFVMLGCKSACEKVASFLVSLLKQCGTPLGQYTQFDLPMARNDIADFLGLTIETVSRMLTKLRKLGLIALDGAQHVIVLDADQLDALANCRDGSL